MSVTTVILTCICGLQALVIVAIIVVLTRAATYDGNIVITTRNGITNFSLEVEDPYKISEKKELRFKIVTNPTSTIEVGREPIQRPPSPPAHQVTQPD